MVTARVCSKLKTSWKSVVLFTNKVGKNSRYSVGVFNKTIIPLALVGYEMIIAKSNAHSWNNCWIYHYIIRRIHTVKTMAISRLTSKLSLISKLNNVNCHEQGYLITDQKSKLFSKASLKLYVMLKIFLTATFFSTKFWSKYSTYLTICIPR